MRSENACYLPFPSPILPSHRLMSGDFYHPDTPRGSPACVSTTNSMLLQMGSLVSQVSQSFFSAGAFGYVNDCPCVIRTQVKIYPLCSCSLSCNPRTSLDLHLRMLIWLDPRAVAPADCDSPERRIVASRSWDHQNYRNHNPLGCAVFPAKGLCVRVNEGCGKHNKYIRDSPLVRFLMPPFPFL